jgi:hypothetical protein
MPATSQSVFPRLEPLLPTVQKPIQYVGGELNSTVKEWASADAQPRVRWALMYPDAYEVGLPNQGVQILYEVLNERDWILAERTYSVWPDMETVMREHGIPQFTVDGHRPVGEFDLFGISFSTNTKQAVSKIQGAARFLTFYSCRAFYFVDFVIWLSAIHFQVHKTQIRNFPCSQPLIKIEG